MFDKRQMVRVTIMVNNIASKQLTTFRKRKKKKTLTILFPILERFLSKIRNDESVTNNKSRMTGVRQCGCDRQKQQSKAHVRLRLGKKTYRQNTNSILSGLFIFHIWILEEP